MYKKFQIQHRLRILWTKHPTSVLPKTNTTCTTKVFVITIFITMPHLNNHPVVHRDGNATIVVAWFVHKYIQVEVDVVIGARWTRECRGVRVVGAACVSQYARQLNDDSTDRLLATCGVSRETNKICKSFR